MLVGAAIFFIGIHCRMIGAEGRDLHRLIAKHHMHELEAPADDARTTKHASHLFRGRVGGNVVVFRMPAQQQIPDRATHDERLVARLVQPLAYADSSVREFVLANAMLVARVNVLLCNGWFAVFPGTEYFFYEFLDHALSLSCRNNWPAVR